MDKKYLSKVWSHMQKSIYRNPLLKTKSLVADNSFEYPYSITIIIILRSTLKLSIHFIICPTL